MTVITFGERKFGAFLFGAELTHPAYHLEVDWNASGTFDDGESEGLALGEFTVEIGRRYYVRADGKGLEPEETGRFSAVLVDTLGRYDPYNTASPIYPNMGPGKLFRLFVRSPAGNEYALMAGTIQEPVVEERSGLWMIHLEGRDGWQFLRDSKSQISIALQEDVYADAAIGLILDAIGWPTIWGRDLDSGVDLQQYWWVSDQSASAAISDLVFSEIGRVWVAEDGKLTFRSRHYVDSPILTIEANDIRYGTLKRLNPWEVIRNSIKVISRPRERQTTGELWRLPDVLRVGPGQTVDDVFADFTFNNESCPAIDVIAPVATTDYTMHSNSDGSGANLTANFTVTASVFSTGAKLTIKNNGTSTGYVTLLKLRGDAVAAASTVPVLAEDATSQAKYGVRTFELDSNWVQNTNAARSFANYLRTFMAAERPYFEFELGPNNPDVQFGLRLGKQIRLSLPNDNIDGYFRVHYVQHRSLDRGLMGVRTTVMVEPFEQLTDEYWYVPHTIPMRVAY